MSTPRLIYWLRCNRTVLRELVAVICLGVVLGYLAVESVMPDERYVVEVRR